MDETLPPSKPIRTPEPPDEHVAPDSETQSMVTPVPTIGPYSIEVKIGEGGMGKVYRCFDSALKRRVAVKVLHEKYGDEALYQARFRREAQVIASLSHPSVAQIYTIDTLEGGDLFLVMEYVDGPSVEEMLRKGGAIPLPAGIRIVRQVASGLEAAFLRGIIHRDIKPSNILVGNDDFLADPSRDLQVKIVDFGLAKDLEGDGTITDDGIVLGTPHYISPEQGRGQKVDQRSDIYSLGATFYHMVTGRPPFEGKSQIAVIVAHVQDRPVPPHQARRELPEAVSQLIGRMMASRPADRYASYGELLDDLDRLESGRPLRDNTTQGGRFEISTSPASRRRRMFVTATLALVLVIVSSVVLLIGQRPQSDALALPDLSPWILKQRGGIDLDFSRTPDVEEALGKVFLTPGPSDDLQGEPRILDDLLRWDSHTQPLACRYAFRRVDEIQIHVESHTFPLFDLGIALVDPFGRNRRQLLVRLRPADPTPAPVEALLSNEKIPLVPELPEIPRLVPPPYTVIVGFTQRSESTQLNLRIKKPSEVFPIYEESCELEGTDWASGVLILKTAAWRYPFRVGLRRVVVSGELSSRPVEEVPWRS